MVRKRSWPAVSHCVLLAFESTPLAMLFCKSYNLELHSLAIELNGTNLEVDADRGDVRLGVCVVGESEQQAGLSYTGVSNEEELEEVVVSIKAGRVSEWS